MLTFVSRNCIYPKYILQDSRCSGRDLNRLSPNTSLDSYCYWNPFFSFILKTDLCTISFNIIVAYFSWSSEWPLSKRIHYRNSVSCLNLKMVFYLSSSETSWMAKLLTVVEVELELHVFLIPVRRKYCKLRRLCGALSGSSTVIPITLRSSEL
jgi:hypothetical protein